MRSAGTAARCLPRPYARGFYLGCTRGAHGRNHEALVDVEALSGPDERMDRGMWHSVWSQGPLYEKVADEDEMAAFKRYQRKQATEQEKARMYGPVMNRASKLHQAHALKLSREREENERLYEARFNLEDSWEHRAHVDYDRVSEDTLARLYVWRVFGGMDGFLSPPTYAFGKYVQAAYEDCVARGELPLAEQRNLEFWCELTSAALRGKRKAEYEKLPETLLGFENDLYSKTKTTDGQLADWINPHRQILTGAFLHKPDTDKVKIPHAGGLDKITVEALKPIMSVMRWYLGTDVPSRAQSKQQYLATQEREMRVRKALVTEITSKPGCSGTTVMALERDLSQTSEALDTLRRNDAVWKKMLPQMNKPLGRELAHLLAAVPAHEDKLPFPQAAEGGTPEGAVPNEFKVDVTQSYQHTLSELLANPAYKKCLLADPTDDVRDAIYEVAWLQTKERAHDIYSEQRKEVNGMLQRARRKLEEACVYVMDDPTLADFFAVENNTPDRRDVLYAPDAYSTDLLNVTVRTSHEVFTTGGFQDNAPGVRA